VRLYDPPEWLPGWIEEQPDGTIWADEGDKADVVLLFAEWEQKLLELLPSAIAGMQLNGGLWIGWLKKASKVPTDITENRLREILLPQGLVDNKVCAIDEKWSGLRFVWRVENRRK